MGTADDATAPPFSGRLAGSSHTARRGDRPLVDRGMAVEWYGRPMFSVGVRALTATEVKHLPIPIDLLQPRLTAPNVVR